MNIDKFLFQNGIKITTLRKELINLLNKSHTPISYDDLAKKLNVNKTTIYRNLKLFEDKEILISSENNGKKFYELTNHAKAYFICDRCKKIEEISMPNLNLKSVKSVVVKGTCDECSK
ncbi:transcriptional repressor [Campylobacter sp. FMV-PI01]|uniref:Transcriptional repressor n=1 Tax=Campylobacter portucalensis TaxID=2608384 RepID=A0A6L5WGV5_9BACT|nr:transcriptional repressor [Campylobacter portucalensis]MSN96264.1 transcriptional repressor [Campylobacter portucalensis]